MKMTEDSELALPKLMGSLVEQPNFASGRDITNWADRVNAKMACRLFGSETSSDRRNFVTVEDLTISLTELLDSMKLAPINSKHAGTIHEVA
jgi:hypothetical protein